MILNHKSLESRGQMRCDWVCYTPLKKYFQGLWDAILTFSKQTWFEKNTNVQNFGTTQVPILGPPLKNPKEKCHLDVVPTEMHRVYYRKRSGASC